VLSPERRFGACPEILSTGLDATKAKTIIQTTMDIFAGWRIGLGAKETKTFFYRNDSASSQLLLTRLATKCGLTD
jgi:hypothetical protein